ncbi:DNA-directed DNA polymerase [Candidatus Woesearchaeota archaeon]|nr:DNA-directed DNA polymerase [Candidatus Woesearchaeota archaeon]
MAKFSFYPLYITYKEAGDEALIYMYGRNDKGEQVCIIDHFSPYFWVIGDFDAVKQELDETVAESKVEKKEYLGEEVEAIRIVTKFPRQIPVLRDKLKEKFVCLEADILFVRRYLIDNEIILGQEYQVEAEETVSKEGVRTYEIKNMKATDKFYENERLLAFDIETHPEKNEQFQGPILMVSFYGGDFRKVVTWKRFKTKEKYIEFVNSEADLLRRFKEIIGEQKPDVLAGYFSDGFDLPYIASRARKYKIKLEIGLDHSEIRLGKGANKSSRITGITHVDVYKFIRGIARVDVDDYRLDTVAEAMLGENKHDVDFAKLIGYWQEGDGKLEDFCKYNLHDAKLTYELCKRFLPQLSELVKIVGLPAEDVNRASSSQLVEWFLIRNAHKFNQLAPNKPGHDEIKTRMAKRFKGAFVFEPKPGLYKDIMIFDFRSLYPTIIASHNIDPGVMKCSCCADSAQKVPLEDEDIWFCEKQKGFLSSVIGDLIERRVRIKEIMKKEKNPFLDARQYSLKLLANSFYGYLGFYAARWYSFDCAQSVTAFARYYIRKAIDEVQKEGFTVIYSDTDSVFLTFDGRKKEEVLKLVQNINKELPGMMELEFEGMYPSGIFVSVKGREYGAKKKYALIDEDDEITIKGFETVRRNWSPIAKDVQKKVLSIILKENDADKAYEYVKKIIEKIKKSEIEIELFAIRTQITKPIDEYEAMAPHVALAKRLLAKGVDIGPGHVIEYVITKGKGRIGNRTRTLDETDAGDIDSEYYIKNQVIPSVGTIFEVLGYDTSDLEKEGNQSKLSGFF